MVPGHNFIIYEMVKPASTRLSQKVDKLIHISGASEMLLNKSYYHWYYRSVFLFRLAVSTWKRTYVNIQYEIYIHKAVTQDLYLLLLFLFFMSSSSFILCGGAWCILRQVLLYSPSWPSDLMWSYYLCNLNVFFFPSSSVYRNLHGYWRDGPGVRSAHCSCRGALSIIWGGSQ